MNDSTNLEKTISMTLGGENFEIYESQYNALTEVLKETKNNEKIPNTPYSNIGIIIENHNVTQLQIQGYNVPNISEDIGQLIYLTQLHLKDNELTCLPNTIGNLTELIILDLAKIKE